MGQNPHGFAVLSCQGLGLGSPETLGSRAVGALVNSDSSQLVLCGKVLQCRDVWGIVA